MSARFRDIKRVLLDFGITAEKPASGSHWKLRDRTGKVFALTCHNGEKSEISDVYVKALCRTYGIDLHEFQRRL